jgi:hypothetical protein
MKMPLRLTKLAGCEDETRQKELLRLAEADAIAKDIIIESAIPDGPEGWARMQDAVRRFSGGDEFRQSEWCYYIGLAVGLRLARALNALGGDQ